MIERLFIGGSADGKRIMMCETQYISVPVNEELQFNDSIDEIKETEIKYQEYHEQTISGNSRQFKVMCLESMSGDEIIERLIDNYRRL